VAEWLADTPFLEWLPVREVELQPLVPGRRAAVRRAGRAGALPAGVLGHAHHRPRAVVAGLLVALGVGATALSAALSWGPSHAWAWLSLPVRLGLAGSAGAGMLLLLVPRRWCAALLLVALVLHLSC
jgi:hypothetical protein